MNYINSIIKKLTTKKNIIDGVDTYKNIKITEKDVMKYGRIGIIDTLKQLEDNPNIDIIVKWDYLGTEINDVKSFAIKKTELQKLCDLAGVKSKMSYLDKSLITMKNYQKNANIDWLREYYNACIEQIEKRGTVPNHWNDKSFHKCLYHIANNNEDMFQRTFSGRFLTHPTITPSKVLDEYKGKIATVLKKYHNGYKDGMKQNEILELCGLYSYGSTFSFLGDVTYKLKNNDNQMVFDNHYTGIILNTLSLREIEEFKIGENVEKIITIENKDNFFSMEYNPKTLYIYTHGFLSPLEVKVCKMIDINGIDCFHWGDLDYGGIMIYKFMKTIFPKIKPMSMYKEDYMRLLDDSNGYDISEATEEKLKKLDAEELEELKEVILLNKKCFEQEVQL